MKTSTQVELRGKSSEERILQLAKYANETSWFRVLGVLIITPLPCVAVTVFADVLPLSDPFERIQVNNLFLVRSFYTFMVLTVLLHLQFRISVPILSYPYKRILRNTVVVSACVVGILYTFAKTIGFPVPFGLLLLTPPWATLSCILMAIEWFKKIQETPDAVNMLINGMKLWACQVLLGFVYPPYFYIFTTLSKHGKTGFALLLPVIKLFMRNVFASTLTHFHDEMPEAVVFTCDVYYALFLSYSMQNSPSIWITLEIMFFDIIMMTFSLRGAGRTRKHLKALERQLTKAKYLTDLCVNDKHNSRVSTLTQTSFLLTQNTTRPNSATVDFRRVTPASSAEDLKRIQSSVSAKTRVTSGNAVHPDVNSTGNDSPSSLGQYTLRVRRLVYAAEFLLLLNYVEVIIPLIFSIYLTAMYHLPNREYYAQIHGMDRDQLVATFENVQIYCSLQLASLLLLFAALHQILGLSPVHQLAFVLEKQFDGVQIKLVFWVYYNVQASLQHNGKLELMSRLHSFTKFWEATQVELHGRYSADRVLELAKYTNKTSWLRIFAVLVITPVPCLVVTVLVDVIPLADPSEGVEGNTKYFFRTYYTFVVITFLAIQQFRMNVSLLPYPLWRAIAYTLIVSALSTLLMYKLAQIIGYPLPFSIITTTPPWLVLVTITLGFEWAPKITKTPGAVTMFLNTIKLWMCEVLLVLVYPPYFFIFTILSDRAQMAFALLLPAIKMLMRFLFSRTLLHLTDEMPETVIFHCDVFNALFVAYCMQNSPSMWTTLEIMFVDIIMMGVSLRELDDTKKHLRDLEQPLEQEFDWEGRAVTMLERARILLKLRQNVKPERIISSFMELKRVAPIVMPTSEIISPAKKKIKAPTRKSVSKVGKKLFVKRNIHPAPRVGNGAPRLPVPIRYTRMVQRLLYMAEFLLLLNYVEVIIPLVFLTFYILVLTAIYLYGMYHLPNHEYYAQLRGMSESELVLTLKNVLFYCSLQLVSLLLLFLTLKKKLGMSPIHHLGFVLDKQFIAIQVKLCFWVYYNAQASLQHSGLVAMTILSSFPGFSNKQIVASERSAKKLLELQLLGRS
ncbi:hypothetical protein P3T76_014042 [Phytophthora citrophthora]|uniref:Uncharacterized protein n=1 Tax=Phytophthora citrophthora TaxID=4793 RepID=A0AAD9G238_9STRA|nr:hypothetical protein P3T76_014042 [Phytophthora citrophthora]